MDTDGCNDDSKATCSLGNGANSRTCTCDVGYSGTSSTLADADSFGGCTDIDGCTLHGGSGCNGDSKATCSLGNGINTRTCTCDVGSTGTVAGLADAASFGGCTSLTYDECINALKAAGTCTDAHVKYPAGWGSNGANDIATIRANPAIASFIDCMCKNVCKDYPEFQNTPMIQQDACVVAASVTNTYGACQNSAEGKARYQKCTANVGSYSDTDSGSVKWDDIAPETKLLVFQGNAELVYSYYCVCNSLW